MNIKCSLCGKHVSSPVPDGAQIRAWISCYECSESDTYIKAIHGLIDSIVFAATKSDWCDPGLAEAIALAEKHVPSHLLR
jgi:hypothetical protein